MSGPHEGDITRGAATDEAFEWFSERLQHLDTVLIAGGPPCRFHSQVGCLAGWSLGYRSEVASTFGIQPHVRSAWPQITPARLIG